jgi:phospholipase/carboxylesterase
MIFALIHKAGIFMTLANYLVKIYDRMLFKKGSKMLDYLEIKPKNAHSIQNIVLFLHGLGSDAEDLISIGEHWAQSLPNTLFISPNAPFPCDMAPYGYQWFSLQDRSEDAMLKGIQSGAAYLHGFIDQLKTQYNLPESKIAVMGFSQGAMMACYAMPRRKEPCAAVLGYAGLLVDAEGLKAAGVVKMPILLVHGDLDEVVPYHRLAEAERGFAAAGFTVEAITCYGLAHNIDEKGLSLGLEKIKQAFDK